MRRLVSALAIGVASTLAVTGCAGGGGSAEQPTVAAEYSQADIDAALEEGADLTFWAWGPQYEAVVEAFNAAYPNMNVTLQNQGANAEQYTKLQNVISAGSGVPDVVQLEFLAFPQFALGDSIVDLNEYGLGSMEEDFTNAAWGASQYAGGLYGLPQDAGPLALFYRQDVFDQFGLEVPTTWEEYTEVARALQAADPARFIAADVGEPNLFNALIWEAGGRPYSVDGTTVGIDFADEGVERFVDVWQPLIDEGLLDTRTAGFTPEWNAGLANGTYATWVTGAWGAGTLQRRIPEASGLWRVAPLPQFEDGDFVTSQNGGSLSAVTEASEHKLAAVGFVQWMASAPEAQEIWVSLGGFPAGTLTTDSDEWLDAEVEYFGGQQINQIFAESAASVGSGWEFLPFQTYANSIFPDSVGSAFAGEIDLTTALEQWQTSLRSYAEAQGFDVE